jgi:glutathione S-transferase
MKLYVSLTSPFARKVRVAVEEKGLEERIRQVVVDPWTDDPALARANPMMQVPALELEDGRVLTDSDTILGWLERAFPQPALWPHDPRALTGAESIAALAQTLLEYTVFLVLEGRRPEAARSQSMIERRTQAILRGIESLESRFHASTGHFHIDSIGVACALAYLDFRQPQLDWRARAPGLDAWLRWAGERPSMRHSAPPSSS